MARADLLEPLAGRVCVQARTLRAGRTRFVAPGWHAQSFSVGVVQTGSASTTPFQGVPPYSRRLAAVLGALVLLCAAGLVSPAPSAGQDALLADACLNDVCFVDAQHGWAVGERGAIWHTDDGGRHWHLQRSGVGCPLHAVCFLDTQTGWAAGGGARPFARSTYGVILRTEDGGRRWQPLPGALLPAIRRMRFLNHREGWAAGTPSPMFPSGVFVTRDGGRSWQPLSGAAETTWQGADLLDPLTGVLAGGRGTAAMVRRGGAEPARMGSFGIRTLHQVALGSDGRAWLTGDGGLVMLSTDLGASWQTPPAALPDGVAEQFDFQALCVRGPRVWIAGSPGTRILFSPDAGHSWQVQPTGVNAPLRAIWFADEQHGWAAGELGTILATGDGGHTWRVQRAGGERAALLGLFARAEEVPLELLAALSGEEGYLAVVSVLGRRDLDASTPDQGPEADRLREAVLSAGGSAADRAWRFPLWPAALWMDAERLVELWDRTNDGHALRRVEEELVRSIRLWRPEIIVTSSARTDSGDPAGRVASRMVLRAVEQAADPTALSDQLVLGGLRPWQVKKVYSVVSDAQTAPVQLPAGRLAPRLGRSLAEVAADARGLLCEHYTPPASLLGFELLLCRLPEGQGRTDFFAGIVLEPGGGARRMLSHGPVQSLDELRRIAQKRRHTEAILERLEHLPQDSTALLAQTSELSAELDPDGAAAVLYHLGRRYHERGQWDAAAQTFGLLADRYPQPPLARRALLWLVSYYASEEAAWRSEGRQRTVVAQAAAELPPGADPSAQALADAVRLRSASTRSIDAAAAEDRAREAVDLARQLERADPELFAHPELRFPVAVAYRRLGYAHEAGRFYLALAHGARRDAWWSCAAGEQWLAEPQGPAPKPVLRCRLAAEKPRLDGRLEEPLWQRAQKAALDHATPGDQQCPAAVMLACDREFLYLAVECERAAGASYAPPARPRPRDPDLARQDRVEILLDLDRDHATWYRLVVDSRAWVAEDCWGDTTWNPTWFVARGGDQQRWTVEAAMPLDQLTGRYPQARDVWALGLQRIVPGVGFQSWSEPAAPQIRPEGFGYLIFE